MPNLRYGDLVTVVVPAFNHERYIESALDSVLSQTYSDVELIVLDDQSQDSTLECALEWAEQSGAKKRFARVVIEKNNKNLGAHATINRAMTMANGNAVAILNSDDAYDSARISTLMQASEECKASLAFSGVRVIDADGDRCLDSPLAGELEAACDLAEIYPSVSFALLTRNIAVSTGNLLFARSLLDKIGNFRPLRYCHDWDFVLRTCLIEEPLLVSAPLYHYRIHGTNSFSELRVEQYLETQAVYRQYFAACRAGNCSNQSAPSSATWPGLFDKSVAEDENLRGSFYLVGDAHIRYDHMARMIGEMFA